MMKNNSQFGKRLGQVALIVILVVVVGLTVVVAVLSRSVTTLRVSTEEKERARAFSAAEAGIEDALRQDLSGLAGGSFQVVGPETQVDYTVTKLTNINAGVNPGQVVTVDWSKSSASQFEVSWSGVGCSAQMVVTTITSSAGVTHNVYSSSPQTIFGPAAGLTRMRFVGCTTSVTLSAPGGTDLSFYEIDSTGTSGQATSQVRVVRSEPSAIGLMDFAVFSGGDVQ